MFMFNRDFRYVHIYIYICSRTSSYMHMLNGSLLGMKSGAVRRYVMWEELSFDHFLKQSNHLKQILKCFKMEPCALVTLFNIQSSDYGATTW